MIRLFVGLELPEDVRHALAGLCGGVPGADWVAPESMHLTLRFIGDVTEADAEDAHDALMRVRAPGFDLSLHGVGHFSTGDELRALWAGVDRSEPLAQLRRNVDSALVRMGFPPEERRWRPHVTLARCGGASVLRAPFGFGGAAAMLLADIGWRGFAVSVLVLLVVRPIAGHLALLGSPTRWNERRAIAFFGIRGVGSVYYLAYAAAPTITEGRATPLGTDDLWPVVACTILLSITIRGITATGVMRQLDRTRARRRRPRPPQPAADPVLGV